MSERKYRPGFSRAGEANVNRKPKTLGRKAELLMVFALRTAAGAVCPLDDIVVAFSPASGGVGQIALPDIARIETTTKVERPDFGFVTLKGSK